MKVKTYILCMISVLLYLFVSGDAYSVIRVLEQEHTTPEIISECLNGKHGVMLRCIKAEMKELDKDIHEKKTDEEIDDLTLWQAPVEYSQRKNPVSTSQESREEGKKIYALNCLVCHGEDGRGQGVAAQSFGKRVANLTNTQLRKKSDGDLFWKITEGSWPMPAFWDGDSLSEEEIWHVIRYIRSFSSEIKNQEE